MSPRNATLISLLLAFVVLALMAGQERAWAEEVVIRAKVVYTMKGEPISPGLVLISDGKIKQVGRSITIPSDVREIDLGEGSLMPGFVNSYTQIGVVGGGAEFTSEITPYFHVLSAIDFEDRAFKQTVREGTTSVCVFPGTENIVSGQPAVLKTAGEDAEHRVVKDGGAMMMTITRDPTSGNRRVSPDSIYMRIPTDRMGLIWVLRKSLDEALRQRPEKWADLTEALEGKMPVFKVAQSYEEVLTAVRVGDEFSYKPIVVDAREAYRAAEELAAAKVSVIMSPLSSGANAGGRGYRGSGGLVPKWNRAGVLHEAGVKFALSGDGLLEQARFAVRCGLPRKVALAAITSEPAKILGISKRVGTIAKGRDADFVALSGDPLGLTTTIRWVMVDGVIQYEEKD